MKDITREELARMLSVDHSVDSKHTVMNEQFKLAAKDGNIDSVKEMVNDGYMIESDMVFSIIMSNKNDETSAIDINDFTKYLIKNGVESGAEYLYQVIDDASSENNVYVLKVLNENGVDLLYNNNNALSIAAAYGMLDTLTYLVSIGADPTVRDNKSFRYAHKKGFNDIIDFLSLIPEVLIESIHSEKPVHTVDDIKRCIDNLTNEIKSEDISEADKYNKTKLYKKLSNELIKIEEMSDKSINKGLIIGEE